MTKHLKLTVLALAVAGTAIAGAANAFPGGQRGGPGMEMPGFEELDANGDGVVTTEELEAIGAARFAELDTNGDGSVSPEEMQAMMQERANKRMSKGIERMMERLDANEDGVLSEDELPQRDPAKMIEHLDEDGDGAISAEEFEAAKEKRGGRKGGKGHGGRG